MTEEACLSEAVLEQSPACHFVVSGFGIFKAIYGDPAPIFGKSAAELAGRSVNQCLSPDLAAIWTDRFGRVLMGESLSLRERRGPNAWHISVFPIRQDG